MPRYTFKDTSTGEFFYDYMSVSERDEYLEKNPHISQTLCTPGIGDSVRLGVRRPDNGFHEALSKVKQAHPLNDIGKNSKY